MGFLGSLLNPSASSNPGSSWASFWVSELQNSTKTTSGEHISPDGALTVSAYYACLRVIAEDCAKLPFKVYRRELPRGKTEAKDNLVYALLHKAPNTEMTSFSFRETLTMHAAGWGNGYAEIVRNGAGDPVEMHPIHPSRVQPKRVDGQIVYHIRVKDAKIGADTVELEASEMFHIHGPGGDGLSGYSLARLGAESIGIGKAAEKLAGSLYANGMSLGGTLTHPGKLSPEAQKHLRESWQKNYGGAENANKVAILQEGMQFTRMGIPPNEAQFLESRQFQIEEICRWCRVAPHKIQHLLRSTFSNIEQQALEHVGDTLMPWLIRWEQEADRKLLNGDPDLYSKHNASALLRGDQAARSNFYRQLFYLGAMSPNDIRELEDMNPITDDGADDYYLQNNLRTIGDDPEPSAPQRDQNNPDGQQASAQAHAELMRPMFLDCAHRVVKREEKALKAVLPKKPLGSAELGEWVGKFFADHSYAVDAFTAPAATLSNYVQNITGNIADIVQEINSAAREHCDKAALSILGGYQINVTTSSEKLADAMLSAVMRSYGEEYDAHA